MEINFQHGDPLDLADQVFLFKRTLRQSALKHKLHATFMAKPMENQPGSAMHIHQSIYNEKNINIFFNKSSKISKKMKNYLNFETEILIYEKISHSLVSVLRAAI